MIDFKEKSRVFINRFVIAIILAILPLVLVGFTINIYLAYGISVACLGLFICKIEKRKKLNIHK